MLIIFLFVQFCALHINDKIQDADKNILCAQINVFKLNT